MSVSYSNQQTRSACSSDHGTKSPKTHKRTRFADTRRSRSADVARFEDKIFLTIITNVPGQVCAEPTVDGRSVCGSVGGGCCVFQAFLFFTFTAVFCRAQGVIFLARNSEQISYVMLLFSSFAWCVLNK